MSPRTRGARLWPLANELLREPSAALLERLIAFGQQRTAPELALAEEHYLPGEDEAIESLLATFAEASAGPPEPPTNPDEYADPKLHGLVRAELHVGDDLPPRYRKGIFEKPRSYPAWVCFDAPGAGGTPDIAALGGLNMSVKLMQVPGLKLLDDEKHTQDLLGNSAPMSLAGTIVDRARLEQQRREQTPLHYFLDPRRPRIFELLVHALYGQPMTSPLECRYHSGAPFLLGQGQAMQYSMRPRALKRTPTPPDSPIAHSLRSAMVDTLAGGEVTFDLLIQVQTDPRTMPIENAAVRWPERLSPWLCAGSLRIFQQRFDTPLQRQFARELRFTPWHAVPEHRPLGSLNRARRRVYEERFGASPLGPQHPQLYREPTGDERLDEPRQNRRHSVRCAASEPPQA